MSHRYTDVMIPAAAQHSGSVHNTSVHTIMSFVHTWCNDASCVVQNALSSSKSEQQCARLEWQQQEGLLRIQVQQQGDALRLTHQQIVALKTGHDEQQHRMQLQHSEVRQSASSVFQA